MTNAQYLTMSPFIVSIKVTSSRSSVRWAAAPETKNQNEKWRETLYEEPSRATLILNFFARYFPCCALSN